MAEDTWSETAFIAITKLDGSDVDFAAITETVDLDIGDKDFDVINTIKGGRLVKFTPQEPTTITLEAYPVEAGTDSGSTGNGFFDLIHSADATQPLSIASDHDRDKYRMVVTWCNNTGLPGATAAITSGYEGFRVVAQNGYFTSAKPSFTDGVLKYTVNFKCPAFDKSATANVTFESTDGTETLTAVSAYAS